MPETTSPYDDDVVDPYAGDDDVKNPHEETESAPADEPADKPAPKKTTARKATKRS